MRGLTILLGTADVSRFRAALATACAAAALGGRTRLYCHDTAVPLLMNPADADSVRLAAAGLADAAEALSMALESDVEIIACQSGLALAGLSAEQLPAGVRTGGLVGVLADLGDDRLLAF